jgi:hypothetical protein
MKVQHIFIAVIAVIVLSGCGSVPPLNFSVPNVGLAQRKIDAELKSMTVTVARLDEKTGDLDFKYVNPGASDKALAEQMVPQLWQTALVESINTMAIFQDDSTKKVNLSVKILKLEVIHYGFPDKITNTEARYEIADRRTGDLIYTQNITSTGAANISYSINPLLCIRESINRAIQNNITQFLQALETLNVQKPMFPAKVEGAN